MTSSAPIQVRVDRHIQIGKSTISTVYIDGEFACWGLEDVFREVKVRGETRIPAGTYELVRRFEGRHFRRYNKAYRHKSTLWVKDVPNYEWIMCHAGVRHAHTAGCLCVGDKPYQAADGSMEFVNSIDVYRHRFYSPISKEIDARGALITYRDLDRMAMGL